MKMKEGLFRLSLWVGCALLGIRATAQERVTFALERPIARHESEVLAEQQLLSEARLEALERVAGRTIHSVESLATSEVRKVGYAFGNPSSSFMETFLFHTRQEVAGRIVAEDTPRVERVRCDEQPWLRMYYSAVVALEHEMSDSAFHATLTTRQPAYRPGDTIVVETTLSTAARMYLFNLAPDGSATLVWPNAVETDYHLGSGTQRVPRNPRRYAFVAELPHVASGTTLPRSDEVLLAIYYRGDAQLFNPAQAFTKSFTQNEINQTLLRIPRALRCEAMTSFFIVE